MSISMYRASAPIFLQLLPALGGCLRKAADYAAAKKVELPLETGGEIAGLPNSA